MKAPILGCVLASAACAAALAQTPNETAVRAAFGHYDHGWRVFDVDEVLSVMAPDCQWVNSVGVRMAGKPAFRRFLTRIFGDANFRAGAAGRLSIHAISFPAPSVAVVDSSEATSHQIDSTTGKAVPVLHTNELTIMQNRGGQWLIVNDLTSDESHGI